MKIEVIHHASIRLEGKKVIYFDPYSIKEERHDADYIFITHDHYDHYDEESINKLRNDTTKIILPRCLSNKDNFLVVDVNKKYQLDDFSFDVIPSYNVNKTFHLKEKGYVGYLLFLEGKYYYIMGDTDRIDEINLIKCDVCFVPIGGIYTMDVFEAVDYINYIEPKVVIPIHYGMIVGDISLGREFKKGISKDIEVKLLLEEEIK